MVWALAEAIAFQKAFQRIVRNNDETLVIMLCQRYTRRITTR